MASQPFHFLTADEYLEIERAAEFKSEYADGVMVAMSGVTQAHDRLVTNITDALSARKLRDGGCERYTSDMKVYLPANNRFCYPDLTIGCEPARFKDATKDVLVNPTVVIEVLSRATKNYDIGDKSFFYRHIDSLRHIILVWHDRVKVGRWSRSEIEDPWAYDEYTELDGGVPLPELKMTLRLFEIYDGVQLS